MGASGYGMMAKTGLLGAALTLLAACAGQAASPDACVKDDTMLNYGFYAYFAPMSYSADEDPQLDGFDTHLGYESDIISALEAMDGVGLAFDRKPIAEWDDIWLKPAGADYDVVGGGITILDSRTRDASGETVARFTSGHVSFRQSLLVRAEDADRLATHDALTSDVKVGALADTTGEARLLELTGLVDAEGVLVAGTRIETPQGTLTADGSADYAITAAAESPMLSERLRLYPPDDSKPQVVYLGGELGEAELLAALADESIDAIARGEIGNRDASAESEGRFMVTALDPDVELGGFALAVDDADLAACIDKNVNWLTDNRSIGYAEWLADSSVFMRRAQVWNEMER